MSSMTILDELAAYAASRVNEAKKVKSLDELAEEAYSLPRGEFRFSEALKRPGLSFICECKKASPSKGIIAEDFPYLDIAKAYEEAGADAISVLTEPKWFLGKDEYLRQIADTVNTPILRKDFTVDEYMIYEAKLLGASAALLIVSILTGEQIAQYLHICDQLGLSALTECHDEKEIDIALNSGAGIIGVNNRNLKDFTVDISLGEKMRKLIPDNVAYVSESGVKDASDVRRLRDIGVDAVLIGETLMREEDKKAMLNRLKGVDA